MAFSIPTSLLDSHEEYVDALINDLGENCKLYYPPKLTNCDCVADSIGNKPNVFGIHGGRIPATKVTCPFCNGTGKKQQEVTEIIKFNIYWELKSWISMDIPINLPDGVIQIRAYMLDMPKLMKADYFIVQDSLTGYNNWKYTKYGEPIPHGFRNKYILMLWKRS